MKKLKIAFFAFCVLLSGAANAGDKKASNKTTGAASTSTTTTTKTKVKFSNTYYVTGTTTIEGQPAYTLGSDPGGCNGTGEPCEISTNQTLSGSVLQSVVEDENQVTIETRKN